MTRVLCFAAVGALLVGGTNHARGEDGAEVAAGLQIPKELLGPSRHITHKPEAVAWKDGPASFEPGSQWAVLEGDPSKPGMFVMRLKLPDGFQIQPHWHPNFERITVLSGTFFLGMGSSFDAGAAERLEAGSFTSMPPGMRHFARVEGETIVQITSFGPWQINYLDSKDDPRLR
jgi:quercetin dioxygenase-like cupin family protein